MNDRTPPPNVPLPTLGGKQIWADVFVRGGWRIQENVLTGHHRLLGPKNVRFAWGEYEDCLTAFEGMRARRKLPEPRDHLVVLLHGMFRAKEVFRPMERSLVEAGFDAVSLNYPSTRRSLDDHAHQIGQVLERLEGARTVSFVGHSLGGLVSRLVVATGGPWRERLTVNRVVTIGTPNHGLELAERLRDAWTFRTVVGPAGQQLACRVHESFPVPDCPVGSIAGVRGDGHGYNPVIEGEDDGVVSQTSALLDGAEDTLVVRCIHTLLMRDPAVIAATVRYLRTGRFSA